MGSKNKRFDPTQDQLEYIISSIINKTKKVSDIAKEFGYGNNAIYSLLKRNGVKLDSISERAAKGDLWNSKYTYDREFLQMLSDNGYCLEHISQIVDIPRASIQRYFNENEIKINEVTAQITPFQFQFMLDKYYKGHSIEECVKGMNYSSRALLHRINIDGHAKRSHILDLDSTDILSLYNSGVTVEKLINRFRVRRSRIVSYLESKGISVRSKSESIKLSNNSTYNDDAFSNFNEEKAAYFYGFLLADGCLSKKTIAVVLKDTDSDILYKLKEYVGAKPDVKFSEVNDKRTGKIYKRCSFQFGNLNVVNRLIEQGFSARKSTEEVLPKFDWLNNRHFWRGLIDGDGHLASSPSTIVFVGSEEIVRGFNEFVNHSIEVKTKRTIKYVSSKNKTISRITFNGDDARNIAKLLYSDCSVYLDRKFKISKEMITWQRRRKFKKLDMS